MVKQLLPVFRKSDMSFLGKKNLSISFTILWFLAFLSLIYQMWNVITTSSHKGAHILFKIRIGKTARGHVPEYCTLTCFSLLVLQEQYLFITESSFSLFFYTNRPQVTCWWSCQNDLHSAFQPHSYNQFCTAQKVVLPQRLSILVRVTNKRTFAIGSYWPLQLLTQ